MHVCVCVCTVCFQKVAGQHLECTMPMVQILPKSFRAWFNQHTVLQESSFEILHQLPLPVWRQTAACNQVNSVPESHSAEHFIHLTLSQQFCFVDNSYIPCQSYCPYRPTTRTVASVITASALKLFVLWTVVSKMLLKPLYHVSDSINLPFTWCRKLCKYCIFSNTEHTLRAAVHGCMYFKVPFEQLTVCLVYCHIHCCDHINHWVFHNIPVVAALKLDGDGMSCFAFTGAGGELGKWGWKLHCFLTTHTSSACCTVCLVIWACRPKPLSQCSRRNNLTEWHSII